MTEITFKGCKHLSYDRDKFDSRLNIRALPGNIAVHWERPDILCNGENKNVQFCTLRGRLNSKISCLEHAGFECHEGEMAIHTVDIPEED